MMRRSLAVFLLLALAAAGAVWGVSFQVGGAWEAVEVRETVLYGERAEALGVTVTNRTQCDGHLFWNTVYTVGEELQVEAEAHFEQQRTSIHGRPDASAEVYCSTNFGISGTHALDGEDELGLAVAPARDVATRTPPGATHTETVRMSDYYEYYPLMLELYIPGAAWGLTGQQIADFASHFRIPVPREHRLEVSVTKNAEGQVGNVECNSVSGEQVIYAHTEVTEAGIYLAFAGGGLPEEVAGVHLIPLVQEGESQRLQTEAITRVWTPGPGQQVLGLRASREGGHLLVIAQAAGQAELVVLDVSAQAQTQALRLPCGGRGVELEELYQYEGFVAPVFSDGSFCVLAGSARQGYELRLTGNFCEDLALERIPPLQSLELAYDGQRLAAVFYQQPYRGAGTCLLVYGPQGLAYAGRYDQSTDRTPPGAVPQVSPVEQEPLAVAWG